jgi:hypothetical protein
MRALTEASQHEFQMQLKKFEATAECGKGTASGMGMVKPPMFDGTFIMGCVLAPVRDCSRAQLLDVPGEIHIFDHHLEAPERAQRHFCYEEQ